MGVPMAADEVGLIRRVDSRFLVTCNCQQKCQQNLSISTQNGLLRLRSLR